MQRSLDFLSDQLHGISSLGVSSSTLVEAVKVSVYGQRTPLKHLASTDAVGQRITIKAFDPSNVQAIAKACQDAGFNAYVFSKESVVVTLPDQSGDTRNETKARIKKLGEDAKVSIRNVRKHFKQGLKDLPKNDRHKEEKLVQNLTDEAVEKVVSIVERKCSYVDK